MKFNKNIAYLSDASQITGNVKKVVTPKNISEICFTVKNNKKIIPRGGGSNFVGGCVGYKDSVVIDLQYLNKVLEFDEKRKKIIVESGIILNDLNKFLENYNLEFPIIPFSKKIATIGGMIATNAVGMKSYKYGRTSKWVEWIEIINPQGEIIKKTKVELSDFAGLEGTTGIITKICLNLMNKIRRTASLIASSNLNDILTKTRELKRISEICTIDFLDKKTASILGLEKKYYLFVEYDSEAGLLKGENYNFFIKKKDKLFFNILKKSYKIESVKILLNRFGELQTFFEKNNIGIFGSIGSGFLFLFFNNHHKNILKKVKRNRGQIAGAFGIGLRKKKFLDELDKKLYLSVKHRNDFKNKFNSGKIADE